MTESNSNLSNEAESNSESIDDADQQEHVEIAADFIANTSLDRMLEISQERFLKQAPGDDLPPEWLQEPLEIPGL
ncbi:MAG: hypothetical protein ACFCBU_03320 [Cyanophyceae cyanobacterium]